MPHGQGVTAGLKMSFVVSGNDDEQLILRSGNLASFFEGGVARLVSFAGQSIPEHGVCVTLPEEYALTVWPNGDFELLVAPCSGCSSSGLDVHFGYLALTDENGEMLGSVSLIALLQNDSHGFRGWTVQTLLDLDQELSQSLIWNDIAPEVKDDALTRLCEVEPVSPVVDDSDVLNYMMHSLNHG